MSIGGKRSRFWQVAFWATVFHFVICGLIVTYGTPGDWREVLNTLSVFERRELGLVDATALWLFSNSPWLWRALAIADLPAAFLMFKLALRSPKRSYNVLYVAGVLSTAAIHAGAIAYLSHVRILRTSHMTYDFEGMTYGFEGIAPFILCDLVIVLPAALMLVGGLLVGWHGLASGFCPACGYDLRATPDRCPECGTPIPKEAADESPRPA